MPPGSVHPATWPESAWLHHAPGCAALRSPWTRSVADRPRAAACSRVAACSRTPSTSANSGRATLRLVGSRLVIFIFFIFFMVFTMYRFLEHRS